MRIYFIRHGESIDDTENRYGGWADFPLTQKGIEQARETGKKLKNQGVTADIILTSPLLRAKQTAEEISKFLGLSVELFVYLKERNTYGLLSGLKKDEAAEKYPQLASAYENEQPVDGFEPYEQFLQRVKKLIELLPTLGYETVICVTHGKLLKALLNDVIGVEAKEFEDNCIIETELEGRSLKVVSSEGVVFE
ncbi:MAG: histidine phosphatase family protein [Candidatus Cloacimonetes bacterium]|nr:histidine phosphatase family protein [Candidatus Cloacimonadota bacterium]